MKIPLVLIVSLALFVGSCSSATLEPLSLYNQIDRAADPNTLTSSEKKNGWQLLFDGQHTDGWHGYNMEKFPDSWAIEDGAFTMNTEGGAESQDIVTDETYKNFAFYVEYKLTPGANSGLIFQVKEDPKYKYPYETGPEFQVIDHLGWDGELEGWQINGANYAMYPPKAAPFKAVGEWNQMLLVVNENYVTQILNGEIVVSYEKYSDEWSKLRDSGKWVNYPDWGKFDEGHIALQNHGTKVWFRSIKLKVL